MADLRNMNARAAQARTYDASIDQGLRAYMIRVYNLMAAGLAITGLAALANHALWATSASTTASSGTLLSSSARLRRRLTLTASFDLPVRSAISRIDRLSP